MGEIHPAVGVENGQALQKIGELLYISGPPIGLEEVEGSFRKVRGLRSLGHAQKEVID